MLTFMKRTTKVTMLGLGLLTAAVDRADAGLVLSVEAAGVQASTISGVTTENFNEYTAGTYKSISNMSTAVGSITSPGVAIVAANQYGGAGGTGNYFAIGAESGTTSATLTFNSSQSYFGFWWSAADTGNNVAFYSAGKLIGSFSSATALANLGSAYYANPNGGGDSSEKFAYLDISGTNGTTIDQVVFTNTSTATGFEADNFSIRSTAPTTPPGTVIPNGIVPSVPEPSSLVLASIGGLFGIGTWCRHRRRAATA